MPLCGVCGGNAGQSHRSNAQKFADQRHRVGGELAAARAGSGTGRGLQRFELSVGDSSAGVFADRFIDVLNGYSVALEVARGDGAAVKNESGNIESSERHNAAGNRLVAANENDQCVEKISARYQLNGIGNDFTAYERGAHALGAHGDAVGDGYGIELQRGSARGADASFHVLGQFTQVVIAGADLNPGVGHSNQRLGEVFIAEPAGAQHGASTGAISTVHQSMAAG